MLRSSVQKIKTFKDRYRVYIMPLVLLLGFLVDMITLQRVDRFFDNLILIIHLLISGCAIVLLFAKDTRLGIRLRIGEYAEKIEYVMLFSFGAVFSGSIIFYSKSASIGSSWPFLLVLLLLMLGTEFQRRYFQRLVFQIIFYFVAVFSYLIILVPVLRKDMGPHMFVTSGLLSLFMISFFFLILHVVNPKKLALALRNLVVGVLSVFLIFNILYFSNIIPPIPLSLKFSGVYHSVYRVSDISYSATYEQNSWWNVFGSRGRLIHKYEGEPVYVFSSVFAPTKLTTKINHQWQYKDPVSNRWIDSSTIALSVTGGRDDGFRGYSYKRSIPYGLWRVIIETDRGQKLGQIRFTVAPVDGPLILREEIL